MSVKYSLLLALVAVADLTSWRALGCDVSRTVLRVARRFPNARYR